jgi:tetratricopeptide (TPR) repeat protein
MVNGGPCSDFPWHVPRDVVMPEMIRHGQEAMQAGHLLKARELFSTYLTQQEDGVFPDGARWVVASLPDPSDEPGKEFFKRIDRLQAMRTGAPESVYAPWALCAMGELYWNAGWNSEASGMFEAFLKSYPEHPLAGGVMVEAGLGYLKSGQFLEAALVLRRVMEEPKWKAHRVKGALGLADATAMAKAWKQAYYWYRVVEAETPELIRQSGDSSYYYGLSELRIGDPAKAISRFLLTINLHPQQTTAGLALNRISEKLFQEGHDFLALWFADQARQRFPDQEPGRRGEAALTRWLVTFLSQNHTKEAWDYAYQRLNELEIYVSLSWDQVVESAGSLRQAPEHDVAEDSFLWMGQAYHALGDIPAAIGALTHFIVVAASDVARQEGESRLAHLLNAQIRTFYARKAWVPLLKFHGDYHHAFHLIPLERERVFMVAQAYQQVNLSSEALHWYDQLLHEYPQNPLREDILVQKILLAEEQQNSQLVREVGAAYLGEFPQGRWRGRVKIALGMDSLANQRYAEAVQYFSEALQHVDENPERRHVLRNRARANHALGHMELAIADWRQVVLIQPAQVADVIRLGDGVFDHGEYEEASRHYNQVLASDAPAALKAWAKYRLAVSLDHMGKYAQAKEHFDEIRQLETRAPELEHTIRSAATAVLDEMFLKENPRARMVNE